MCRDIQTSVFLFDGNFCSWNCAKSYQLHVKKGQRPEGYEYLSLLAFLTHHRPSHCEANPWYPHDSACKCLDVPFFIKPAPSKECLHMFGGPISIKDYRKGFMRIERYEYVERFFRRNPRICNTFYHIRESLGVVDKPRKTSTIAKVTIGDKKDKESCTVLPPPIVRDKKKTISYFHF